MSEAKAVGPLRVALVGAGYIAGFAHLPVLSSLSEAKVVALCDADEGKAWSLARRFGIPAVYRSLDEMLEGEQLDLVDVCVPPHGHKDALTQALGKGRPCLLEKPLTVSTADADFLVALSKRRGCGIYVLHTFSVLPCIQKARALVRQGAVGRILGVDINYLVPLEKRHLDPNHWCHLLPGDYFSEAGPHLAMLLVEFLGPVRNVKAMTAKRSAHPAIRTDEVRIIVESELGLGTINCSFNCPARQLTMDIVGTEGLLHVDGNSQAVVHYGALNTSLNSWARGLAATRDILSRTVALAETTASVLVGRYQLETYGHRYLIERCLGALRGQEEYPVDLGQAREAVRLLEMAFAQIPSSP